MVTESTKKLRELLAFVLLGVAAVLVLVPLSMLLFKSEVYGSEIPDGAFSYKSTLLQGDFVNPVLVLIVVAAVVMVTHLGEPTPMAKIVTISGTAILGVSGLLGLVTLAAGFGMDERFESQGTWYGTIEGSEKLAGTVTMLGLLVLVGGAMYFSIATLTALPSAKPQQQWGGGQQAQWGAPGAQPAPWGQPDQQQWGQPQDQQWAQPAQDPWGQQQWGQPAQPQDQWGQQQWGQPQDQAGSWGQPQEQQWGQPQDQAGSWGQPQEQQWGQPAQPQEQQWGQPQWGQPQDQAGSWGQPQEQQWGQEAPQWGQPAQPEAQPWGQPQDHAGSWGQPQEQQWGQPDPQPWGQPQDQAGSWGQPQEQQWGQPVQPEAPQWGQPAQPDPQPWGQPQDQAGSWGQPQEQQWGQPVQPEAPQWGQEAPQWGQPAQPDPRPWEHQLRPEEQTTQAWSPAQESAEETGILRPEGDQADDDNAQSERDNRPGWWNPSS